MCNNGAKRQKTQPRLVDIRNVSDVLALRQDNYRRSSVTSDPPEEEPVGDSIEEGGEEEGDEEERQFYSVAALYPLRGDRFISIIQVHVKN